MENAKVEYKTGVAPKNDTYDNAAAVGVLINYFLLTLMFFWLLTGINREYGNGATKFFISSFPREAAILGIRWPDEGDE